MTMAPTMLLNVFVNRMSLTLGTGQPHNDFCLLLLCACVRQRRVRLGGRERVYG